MKVSWCLHSVISYSVSYLKNWKVGEYLMSSASVISLPLSLMTSLGDDISGSGSGMCVGSQCPRNRPGLYAYPPDNNRVTGASMCQTRLCSLLLLLPLVLLLLLRWWTTPLPRVRLQSLEQSWTTRRTEVGCVAGMIGTKLCQKMKETFWEMNENNKMSKKKRTVTIFFVSFCSVLKCLSSSMVHFVELVSAHVMRTTGEDRNWEDEEDRKKRMMKIMMGMMINDELLTLYQIHLAPVSSQQVAELSEKGFFNFIF